MVSAADAERLRLAQRGIRSLVERDLSAYLSTLDLSRPEQARSLLLRFVPDLVETYGESAASLAADWYDEVRAAEGLPGAFRALMPDARSYFSVQRAAAEGTVRRAAEHLFTQDSASFLTSVSGKAGKYAAGGSRETIRRSIFADPQGAGWQRNTRAGACRFCQMLAGRGAVYMRDTAHFASHDDCNCAAVPSWDRSAPEVDVDLYKASERTTAMTDEQRAEHNALIHRAIAEYT